MHIDLTNLELLPQILEKLENLEKEIKILRENSSKNLDLTKRDGVRKYLDISESTLSVMMKDGRLKQNVHYIRDIKGQKPTITFIESAIKELKVS